MYNYLIYTKNKTGASFNFKTKELKQISNILIENYGRDKLKSKLELKHELNKNDFIAVAFNNKIIEGYMTGKIHSDLKSIHYSGLTILPKASGKGVAKKLIEKTFKRYKPNYISFSTQNPIIYSLFSKNGFKLYPNINNEITQKIKLFCKKIIKQKNIKNFIEKDFLIKNKYDKYLYNPIPESKDTDLNYWFLKKIKAKNGKTKNAIFIIGTPFK